MTAASELELFLKTGHFLAGRLWQDMSDAEKAELEALAGVAVHQLPPKLLVGVVVDLLHLDLHLEHLLAHRQAVGQGFVGQESCSCSTTKAGQARVDSGPGSCHKTCSPSSPVDVQAQNP